MREKVIEHIKALFRAHEDLAEILPDEAFGQKLSIPSNTIGEQFWCLIGARESYAKAIKENGWAGFSCSMPYGSTNDKHKVLEILLKTAQDFERTINGIEWTADRDSLLLDLLEHEAQHQGQLIRYVYGLEHKFPKSWAERWALDE